MLVYLSGKYSGDVDANIAAARQAAIVAWESGLYVFTPHLNTSNFERDCKATYNQYIAADLDILTRCDAIVMLPGWEDSNGAKLEFEHAKRLYIPVWFYPELPPAKHVTEQRCPQQAQAFLETVMRMYRVHLKKNADYSPANILMTGEVGLITRLWDKIARLLNLTGFRFSVTCDGFDNAHIPENESVNDTYMDAAVYSIIGLLLRQGVWGR